MMQAIRLTSFEKNQMGFQNQNFVTQKNIALCEISPTPVFPYKNRLDNTTTLD